MQTRIKFFPDLLWYACLFCCLGIFAPQAVQAQCPPANIIYVNDDAPGSNNGTSWANAFTDLQSALNSTCPGITQIWVAAGTYTPSQDPFGSASPTDSRDKIFYVKDGIGIYGGFAGTETMLSQRNIATNTTTLSGDFNSNDIVSGSGATLSISNNSENAYHVVLAAAPNGGVGVTIDGFSIRGGNANGSGSIPVNGNNITRNEGGGMHIFSPLSTFNGTNTLTNNTLSGNSAEFGGGIRTIFGSNALTNNTLSRNTARFGGGISTNGFNTLTNNTLSGNSAIDGGGGITISSGFNILINNTLSGNSTSSRGGGIFTVDGTSTLTNNTLSGNSATSNGGGIYTISGSNTLTNNIFWDNKKGTANNVQSADYFAASTNGNTFKNNLLQLASSNYPVSATGNYAIGTGASGNIFAQAPLFTDAANGDFTLQTGSPCINTGDDAAWTNTGLTTDAEGSTRPVCVVDIGVYEYQATVSITTYYVDADGDNYGTGSGQDFCENPGIGWVLQAGDCDDTDSNINPDAPEACNDVDDNCDNQIDEGNVCCPTGHILYVKATATGGNNDGTSWTDAFTSLQSALASTCPGITEIWVAEGNYTPGTTRTDAFVMKNNLAIYGGFPNTGDPVFADRNADPATNGTILSGDIGNTGNADNSYNVILNDNNVNATAVLDGFTIRGGNADGSSFPHYRGGGMYNGNSSPTVTNCTFSGNFASSGGGMYNYYSSPMMTNCSFSGNFSSSSGGGMNNYYSSPMMTNCSFSGNSGSSGGGMYNYQSSPTVTNCSFSGNSGSFGGGGMYNSISSTTVTNCSFSGNSAANGGGGMTNFDSSPTVANCSFSGNSASSGGGMYNVRSGTTVTNCILWGNSSEISIAGSGASPIVTYSIVQGGYGGTGNLNVDPLFVSQPPIGLGTSGDLRLQACSPAIDAGADGANTAATDLDGNDRTFEAIPDAPNIDLGAYEYQSTLTITTYYVDADGDNYGTGAGQTFCEDPGTGWALQTGDCDDNAPNVNPGSPEICDGIDNNCINGIDENNICCPTGNTLYVKANATGGNNDGTSWANAFTNLQSALNSTCSGITQIWVAEGTYTPGTARTDAFVMKNNLAIYGGFVGTETLLSQRNWTTNVTTLSGEIGAAGNADNSYHVIFNNSNGLNPTAVLDGFTVTGGNADGSSSQNYYGGGMYNNNSSPTVINCVFSGNSARYGGGMYNQYSSSPTVSNCTFSVNYAAFNGSGMYNQYSSSPTVSNCSFSGNYANSSGGGMYNIGQSSPTVTNCTFSGNTGGGMVNFTSCSPMVSNCTFSANSASQGGGMYNNSSSSPTISNCTFSGNSAANDGGGMFNIYGSDAVVSNCTFSGNYATNGGGTYNGNRSYPVFTNCLFLNNGASQTGGAMYNPDFTGGIGSSAIINCTFSGNSAASGSVANNVNTILTMTNCILWGNTGGVISNNNGTTNFNNSIVQGGYSPCTNCPNGNGDVDPLFVSTTDLRLQECSPAIDAGTASGAPGNDIEGNGRVDAALGNGIVDMGAYEFQGTVPGPTPFCASNLTVQLEANLTVTVTAAQIGDPSDGCAPLSFLIDGESSLTFDCDQVGPQTVTLQVIDLFMNVETTTCSFTVADDVNTCCAEPIANCQAFTAVLVGNSVTVTPADVDAGSTADCGLQALSVTPNTFSCADVGTPQTVTLTITDINGDSDACQATVTVQDNIAPVALCQNVTLQLDANGNGSLAATAVDNGSTDACGIASLSVSPNSFDCEDVGANTVTLTVTDNNGNPATCTATATVQDNVVPVALCQNVTLQLDANGDGSLAATAVDNGSTDACGIASLSVSPNSFDCEDVGANTVTLTVTDNNGNPATCTATATVEDNVAPMITLCEGTSVVFNGEEEFLASTGIDFSATDACGLASTTYSPAVLTCEQLGLNVPVSVTVTDNNGKASTCITTVKVDGLPCGFMDFDEDGIGCEDSNEVNYDASTQSFTLESDGCYTGNFAQDDAAYVKAEMCGNGEIIAHITSINPLGQGWAGITMRESEAPGAKKVELLVNLGSLIRRAVRTTTNGYAAPAQFFRPGATWLKLVRTGNQFLGYASTNGTNWQLVLGVAVPMNTCIQAGLMVTNYSGNGIVTGTFDNVSVSGAGNMNLQIPNTNHQLPEATQLLDFSFFPNPATSEVQVDLSAFAGQEAVLRIYNQVGQVLVQSRVEEVTYTPEQLDLNQLPSGTYFLEVISGEYRQVKKLVKAER